MPNTMQNWVDIRRLDSRTANAEGCVRIDALRKGTRDVKHQSTGDEVGNENELAERVKKPCHGAFILASGPKPETIAEFPTRDRSNDHQMSASQPPIHLPSQWLPYSSRSLS